MSETHNGSNGNGNGNGPTNAKGTGPNGFREHLVQIARHGILPSVHLFVYMSSYLN